MKSDRLKQMEAAAPWLLMLWVFAMIGVALHVMNRMEAAYFSAVINELRLKKSQETGEPFEPIVWRPQGDIIIDVSWWQKAIGCKVD